MKGQAKMAFYLIIDHRIRDHIIRCTEEEVFKVLGTRCELDTTKPDVLYKKNLNVLYLWNKIWSPAFFQKQ